MSKYDFKAIHAGLKAKFRSGDTLDVAWRRKQLEALQTMLTKEKDVMEAALRKDFVQKNGFECLAELRLPTHEVENALANLNAWSSPSFVSTPLSQVKGLTSSFYQPEPYGVVFIVAPWNYPWMLCLQPLISCLAAGNVALIKPSSSTPAVASCMAELLPRYLDSDAVSVVEITGSETTEVLKLPFDLIFYTGSGPIGKVIMRAASEHLTPVVLELGGKSPVYVDKDCDMDVTCRRLAWAKLYNMGQTCIAPDYVLAHKDIKDELIAGVRRYWTEFFGDIKKNSPDLTRIINVRNAERLQRVIESAGGTVLEGGDADTDNRWVDPTIIDEPDLDAEVMTEEIFGPIMPVHAVSGPQEVIDFVLDRPKPLALYLFSSNRENINLLLKHISAGGVTVNDALMHAAVPDLPFGGVGASGMGAYHGKFGFDICSHQKAVLDKSTWFDLSLRYPPYTDGKYAQQRMLF